MDKAKHPPTFLRVADVAARLGLSPASVYRLMKTADFPAPLQLTKNGRRMARKPRSWSGRTRALAPPTIAPA